MSESLRDVLQRAKVVVDAALRAAESDPAEAKALLEKLPSTPEALRAMAEGNEGCNSGCTRNLSC